MEAECVIQGRIIRPEEVVRIRRLLAENSQCSRYKVSRLLCELWDWRDPKGQVKDMAARSLLLKLHDRGWIALPAKRRASPNRMRHKQVAQVEHVTEPIRAPLGQLLPLAVRELSEHRQEQPLLECLLHRYHYLSHTSAVGLNLKYLVYERGGRPVACLLFGSAAWQCAVRDQFIGWSAPERQRALQQITNNTRFLILPWVDVRFLASHVLGRVLRQIAVDWERKYSRPLHLVETFVDTSRFVGRCYRAANWIDLGQTTGRTRQDRWNQMQVTPKRVWVYPLTNDFRSVLRS